MLLIGDLGGTKTNLAIYSIENKQPKLEISATFRSVDFSNLETIVQKFLTDAGVEVTKAVFGVAGPVDNGQARITNLSWEISEVTLSKVININLSVVKLLNDLEATAFAIPHLADNELTTINGDWSNRQLDANKVVVAPGTGLGEAILFYHGGQHHVIPSEGGHASFAPTTPLQIGLLHYMLSSFNHVSYERVCSGSMGIPNIFAYLSETRSAEINPNVTKQISQTDDPAPIIVNAAMKGECEVCLATLNTFISILGNEAGNIALKAMATGGVYLGGGIPPRILPKLKEGGFMAAYTNKGRFSDLLSHIPVYVILNDKAALLGAAYYGMGL
jgi:glucokinase